MSKRVYIILLIVVVSAVIGPIIINEAYKSGDGYITLWGPEDVLSYFGAVISSIGAITIGIIAIQQSNQANIISDRLLKIEEKNSIPYLTIDADRCVINELKNNEIDISIFLFNSTSNVINITTVENLKLNVGIANKQSYSIEFCKEWTKHYSVLPNQRIESNFYKADSEDFIDFNQAVFAHNIVQFDCEISLCLQYANTKEKFKQEFKFTVDTLFPNTKERKHTMFSNIENSIEIKE